MAKTSSIKNFRLIVTIFMTTVIVLGFAINSVEVFALTPADYAGNDILFFDPTSSQCAAGGGGGSLSGSDVEEKIWNYLTGKGLSGMQAAGVMGNMQAESGFIPTSHQNVGDVWNSNTAEAWGLAQWDGGRRYTAPDKGIIGALRKDQPALQKYIDIQYDYHRSPSAKASIPPADLDALTLYELNYLYEESQARRVTAQGFGNAGSEWSTLKQQTTIENATVFWHNNFEISKDSAATVLSVRGGLAKNIYAQYSHNAPSAGSADNSVCGNGADVSNLGSAVESYAWPDYHPANYINAQPAYTAAIKTAQAQGRYVGGGQNPGIDCGGFVTTLMYDSGFDKTYNSNAKGGITTAQEAWVKKNWQTLGSGGSINVADLRSGDVAFLPSPVPSHTFVYTGKLPGFGKNDPAYKGVASASFDSWRAPMAGHESLTDPQVTWYRKK